MRALAFALIALAACASADADATGRVVGTVKLVDADGKPANTSDVIVYVVGFSEPAPAGAMTTIRQHGRKFVPDLVAITVGESVTFPNDDPFLHNVFSQSSARKFDLGSFKKGDSKDKDFKTPGVVDVYCNIHPEMAATVLVLPNRRHVRANADGKFVLDGVPPGQWTVFAYARRTTKPASAKVSVSAGHDATVELSLARGAEPPHPNKYGEKYKPPGGVYE